MAAQHDGGLLVVVGRVEAVGGQEGPVYMLASHVKLNWDSNFVRGPIDAVTTLITNKGAVPELLTPFQELGIEVIVV